MYLVAGYNFNAIVTEREEGGVGGGCVWVNDACKLDIIEGNNSKNIGKTCRNID